LLQWQARAVTSFLEIMYGASPGLVRRRQQAGELTIMPRPIDPSRDLLFGLLALQTGLIDQTQLVAAFHAWTQARDRPMAEILAEHGATSTPCVTLVEGLVDEHLRRHGSDPERSLAAIRVGRSTRDRPAQIGDPELDASLAQVGSGSSEHNADPERLPPGKVVQYCVMPWVLWTHRRRRVIDRPP
jgi:hypothetical protein